MAYLLSSLFLILIFLFPIQVFARVTPNDIYKQKRAAYEANLSKITDPTKKQAVIKADQTLNEINQSVCIRFDADIAKLSAILEEVKAREGVIDTVVAYGRGDTPLDNAAYYLNYAAEAVAYQKIQDYTPQIGSNNFDKAVISSKNNLRANLITVQGKILKAKSEIKKALVYYEK